MSDRKDEMHYEAMAQEALRGVVKAALRVAASPEGLPGEHHLYVSFQTRAPGVSVPPDLIARYPEEMTIVLQNQFWDLAPGETFFSVMLKFGGQPKKLSVPYAAVTRLHDPSVGFALQFEPASVEQSAEIETLHPRTDNEPSDQEAPKAEKTGKSAPKSDGTKDDPKPEGGGPKIVSLDQFRKK